jgi:hypothetical protein
VQGRPISELSPPRTPPHSGQIRSADMGITLSLLGQGYCRGCLYRRNGPADLFS